MNKDCVEVSTEQRPMTFSEQLLSLAKRLEQHEETQRTNHNYWYELAQKNGEYLCETLRALSEIYAKTGDPIAKSVLDKHTKIHDDNNMMGREENQ